MKIQWKEPKLILPGESIAFLNGNKFLNSKTVKTIKEHKDGTISFELIDGRTTKCYPSIKKIPVVKEND